LTEIEQGESQHLARPHHSSNTSLNKSRQLDYAIPQSTIAALSAGEVVDMVADYPDQCIPQKMIHGQVQHDFAALKKKKPDMPLDG
jgi:hypothetical protein